MSNYLELFSRGFGLQKISLPVLGLMFIKFLIIFSPLQFLSVVSWLLRRSLVTLVTGSTERSFSAVGSSFGQLSLFQAPSSLNR